MTLIRLSSLALSRSRFALSPLAETVAALLTLARPCTDPWLADWHARHRGGYRALVAAEPLAGGLVELLSSTRWWPDVATLPPPGGMRTTLAGELPAVAAMPDERVRATVEESAAHSWHRHDLAWLAGTGLGPRIADAYRLAWTRFVAPDWPRRRAALERDVMYRAGLLAAYGWPAALVYPARGGAAPDEPPAPGALDRLVGAGRAAILRELEHPATSSELASVLGVSLGTVGGHLTVLREAGLVVGARVGRRVVYRRTATGDALCPTPVAVR